MFHFALVADSRHLGFEQVVGGSRSERCTNSCSARSNSASYPALTVRALETVTGFPFI
jgi:hypothetical protein